MPTNGTLNQMRDYLTDGFWTDFDNTSRRSFDISASGSNGVIKYNVTGHSFDSDGLTAKRANLVRDAFKYLENVTGIDFQETNAASGNGVIYFQDTIGFTAVSGSYDISNGHIGYSGVNISKDWPDSFGSTLSAGYVSQTILHEVGHALGLGHPGDYNYWATYSNNAKFTMDSWQNSIMSYFTQTQNTAINASFAFVQSMMSVDLLALDKLYGAQSYTGHTFGTTQAFTGNTVYGFNTNISAATDPYLSQISTNGKLNAYTITDGGGNDTLDFSGWSENQKINLTPSNANAKRPTISDIGGLTGNLTLAVGTIIENARGGSGNDTITGNAENNSLVGNGGNDWLYGGGGNDQLFGGSGNDKLYGADGDDKLYGNIGNDTLYGDAGNDLLIGGEGADALYGGTGADTANYQYSPTNITVSLQTPTQNTGEAAGDTYNSVENLLGSAHNDILSGNNGSNKIEGNSGNDTIYGLSGSDSLWGQDGADRIYGQNGNDSLVGGNGNDVLLGGAGDDKLYGQNDNDTLYGEDGNDKLYGQAGDDVLNGGAGIDTLDGGPGNDTAIYIHSKAGVMANLSNGKAWSSDPKSDTYAETSNGNIALKNVENLNGSKYNDIFVGNTGNNILRGGDGNDTLYGQSGSDGLYGQNGNDILYGQGGNDVLRGDAGADRLEGGPGQDRMYAGVDNDRDVFIFNSISDSGLSSTSRDRIYEFDSGEDDINLSVIDANTSAGGNQAFAFSTTGAAAHSVWVTDTGSNLVVYGDVNGNTTADFSIEVVNINTLLANDFIL